MPEQGRPTLEQAFSAWQAGRLDEAQALCNTALQEDGQRPDGWLLQGVLARQRGDLPAALQGYQQAIQLKPDYADAWFNLGNLYQLQGQTEAARTAYVSACQAQPEHTTARNALGHLEAGLNRFASAISHLQTAIRLKPDYAEAHNNLGRALWLAGYADQAAVSFRNALRLSPHNRLIHSNLLTLLHYLPDMNRSSILAEHRQWASQHAGHITPGQPQRNPDPHRPLRIGYVSSNFRHDAAGCFISTPFLHHDHSQFSIYAYADNPDCDAYTRRFMQQSDQWIDSSGMDDDAFAQQVESDQIDILIDLNGHTGRNRLLAFARRLAPVQASWLGYEGTTGIASMDYLLADTNVVPTSEHASCSEKVLSMPFDFQCWTPPQHVPEPAAPPCLTRRHITFGSFNKSAKLNPDVLALWARILLTVPDSRLYLKCAAFADPAIAADFTRRLNSHGIDSARLTLHGPSPYNEMMDEYRELDIALDPFPFSGGATSCDALWMGVPMVTLRGHSFAANHTVSHVQAAGFPHWVASSPDDYIAIAAGLAANRQSLASLRHNMRQLLLPSPLCNGQLFTRQLELQLRQMWHNWCELQTEQPQ